MESFYNKLGITTQPTPGAIPMGVTDSGTGLYGSPVAVNDNTPDLPAKLTASYQKGLNVIGAATKEDNSHLNNLQSVLKDPKTLQILDQARASGDISGFTKTLSKLTGATPNGDEAKAAFDAWGALTPNQKGAAVMHLTGKSSEINSREYVPGVNTGTALQMQAQGIPMKNVKGNLSQVQALSSAIGHDQNNPVSAIKQVARGGFLGAAQKLTPQDVQFYQLKPSPQYGVGALEMPQNPNKVPQGYTIAGNNNGKQIIVPQGNEASVAFNPQANGSAAGVYSTWKHANKLPASNGSSGGSAMYRNLTQLYDTNPKALGAALDSQISGKGTLPQKASGLALKVLTTGDPSGAKPVEPNSLVTSLAKAGVQSKDVGYKLANQAYAEGRINDSHLFAIHRALDHVFHGDNALSSISPPQGSPKARIQTSKTPTKIQPGTGDQVGSAVQQNTGGTQPQDNSGGALS